LRILTVSHFFESHGGGIERVAGHLCRQFARLGALPVWIASDGDPLPAGDIEALPIGCLNPIEKLTGLPMPIPGIPGIRTLAREIGRSDVVIVHDALYLTSILALVIAKARSKRVTLIQHIAAIPFTSAALRALMRIANILITRPMLWAADERVFISDAVRRELLGSRYGRGTLLFNGVDGMVFHPVKDPREVVSGPKRYASRILLFVGRYVEKKGLRVLRALAEARPETTFLLVGDGPIRPSEWGLPNVHDLGPQAPKDLADLYRSANLLILPSVGEGYPLVIQEAMACGLPVVCGAPAERADPEAAQWVRGVEIDLTVPETSAQRCAEAIDSFSLSTTERAKMADYARRRYSWSAMARNLVAAIQ
jgi:glycosyltransferase involved in cell wall biosynthesis